MQKSHILLLDSRDRINPLVTESNNCTLRIDPAVGGFNKVELLSFNVPNIQFNVDSTNNLIYFDDGAPLTATLTPGAYNYISLPVEVKAQLQAKHRNFSRDFFSNFWHKHNKFSSADFGFQSSGYGSS